MSGAPVTADHAQTSDRTAGPGRRIRAVAPVDDPGGADDDIGRVEALIAGTP